MANEQLTIGQDKARLSVIGKSWPDMNFDSGIGLDLSQIIFDILIDLDIPMPDIDFDDLDDITIIPGLDIDTEIPTLEYPEPDWPDDEIPPIIDWPMPDLDWDDFIDKLEEDFDLDPDILKDLSFTGLNDLGIPTLVSLDEDFNIQEDELPASIEIVTMPNKLEYQDGERIDLTGMVVTAKKADGSTWTSAKYPNGHIPLGELIVSPYAALEQEAGPVKISDYLPSGIFNNGIPVYQKYELIETYKRNGKLYDHRITYEIEGCNTTAYWREHEVNNFHYKTLRIIFGISPTASVTTTEKDYHTGETIIEHYSFDPGANKKVHDNKMSQARTYYFQSETPGTLSSIPVDLKVVTPPEVAISDVVIVDNDYYDTAWSLVYGEDIECGKITILWKRPNDDKNLSTSFEIVFSSETGNGGR